MQVEPGSGCQLQKARRRRGLTPDECEMDQNICDISLWLMVKFQISFAPLWIDRHHFQQGQELARVTVTFVALGYRFVDTGEAVCRRQSCDGTHSKHDALRAYACIEAKIMTWQKSRK